MTAFRGRLVALLAILATAGCASTSDHALRNLDDLARTTSTTNVVVTTTSTTKVVETTSGWDDAESVCDDETESLRPTEPLPQPMQMPPGSFMAEIQTRKLRVGVDENTLGFAFRDLQDRGKIKGFEVELANEIAARIFGPVRASDHVELVPVLTEEKRDLKKYKVDLTIDAISMSCERWKEVAFSVEYYTAKQEFLVRKDSPLEGKSDLPGRKVCVTKGSSSIGILKEWAPRTIVHVEPERTACLVALQEHEVDAYFGHDSFLYGMQVQDPTMEIRRGVLPAEVTTSHYGIAVALDNREFVRFINAVLEQMPPTTWAKLHRQLEESLRLPEGTAQLPVPRYRV